MTTFSPEAQQLFDRYLHTVRWSVRGVADADEVERDVREHVASALEQQEEPISSHTLRAVLSRLGDPWQWVALDELPFWRRIMMRFSLGPEDWRLAYTCFALTLLGLLLLPFGVGLVFLIGAFLLARATYELAIQRDGTVGPRRWLVYPPLVVFSAIVAGMILFGPVSPVANWGIEKHGFELMRSQLQVGPSQTEILYPSIIAMLFGTWWIVASGILAIAIRPVRSLLVPVGNGLRRVHLLWLTAAGAVVAGLGAAAFFRM